MNSNPKNSLEYSNPQVEQFSDNTVLEVLPQKTDEDTSTKYVLIKHDYFSSDSEHGREMLAALISGLCESSFNSIIVYLVDKGTLLLSDSNPLFDYMQRLINRSEMVIADDESLFFYNVEFDSNKVDVQSFKTIAEDIIYFPNILILE